MRILSEKSPCSASIIMGIFQFKKTCDVLQGLALLLTISFSNSFRLSLPKAATLQTRNHDSTERLNYSGSWRGSPYRGGGRLDPLRRTRPGFGRGTENIRNMVALPYLPGGSAFHHGGHIYPCKHGVPMQHVP